MLARKTLLDYTNLFSPKNYKKNDKIIYISILKITMVEEPSLQFRLRKIYETRNHLLDETKHNDLISEKYKNTCKYLNYVEHLLILASIITGCISISAFASLVCIPVGITSSAVGTKIFTITAEIKKYKSILKKKKKKHYKIIFLEKDKLNSIEVLISKALIDSYISHDEFILVNNVLREYYEMKKEIKQFWNFCGIYNIKLIDISRKPYEKNGIETIVDNDGMWLNEKHIEKG